jgi:beta-glucosidase
MVLVVLSSKQEPGLVLQSPLLLHLILTIQAALFPCGVSLAATWDTKLMYEVGQHLAEETKARAAHVLLAPTVCLHRGPLGGRNFESFSEDPLLTGKLAASYIKGLQERGISATIKRMSSPVLTHHVN